jgi:hypothetical protein
MDFGEMVNEDVEWIQVAQDRIQWEAFVVTAVNFRVV